VLRVLAAGAAYFPRPATGGGFRSGATTPTTLSVKESCEGWL